MTSPLVPAPLGPEPVLPPSFYCPSHVGDEFASDPCPNCVRLSRAERLAYIIDRGLTYPARYGVPRMVGESDTAWRIRVAATLIVRDEKRNPGLTYRETE